MSDRQLNPVDIDQAGWEVRVDEDDTELHIEHVESGTTYVFDSEGNLTVPGDGAVGDTLRDLQSALASATETDGHESPDETASTASCSIECNESTGEVTIESDNKVSIAAPTVELSGANRLDVTAATLNVSSSGHTTVDASGVLTMKGALIELN